jgi:uncharacterized repeat protein (TIGR01451 family)
LLSHSQPVQAASGSYADIIAALDVEVGTVTLPGAEAEGFDPPHRWTVTVNDPGKVHLDALRQRYEDLIHFRYVDWTDTSVQEKVARMNQDLAWRVNQQDPDTGAIAGGLSTIHQLALAYHVPGTPHYHDSATITDHIQPAILYERDHGNLHPENGFPGNWWGWEVSVPFKIVDILFAVGDQLDTEPRDALEDMLIWTNQWSGRNCSSSPPFNKSSPSDELFSLTEANGAWFRILAILTGLYFRLPPVVQWGVDEINHMGIVNDLTEGGILSHGVKPDYTFWDHARAPNQLYGDHMFETLSFTSYLVDGSPRYGLEPQVTSELDTYLHEWLRWNTYHDLQAPATRGRWPHRLETGEIFMGVVFRLGTGTNAYPAEMLRLAADWLAEHPGDLDMHEGWWGFSCPWFGNFHLPGDGLIVQPLIADAQAHIGEAADPPVGARYYPYSEFLAMRRPGWYGSFAMHSALNPMGNANRAHDAGLILLTEENYVDYQNAGSMAYDLYDGVTGVEGEPFDYWLRDQSPLAGAATLDQAAAAGMALHVMESSTTWIDALKSCFFFDTEIVCLGSDITSDDGRPARTYIRSFPEETHELQSGSGWLHDGTVGVVLPGNPAWESERLTDSDDPTWLRLYLPHGVRPQGASYTMIYLPRATRAETQQYAGAPDASILAHTDTAHVARDASSGLTGAVFFAGGSAADHRSSHPGHLMYQVEQGKAQSLAFHNPGGESQSITLSVPVPACSWLAAQLQSDPAVESFTPRSDGFDVRITMPARHTLEWVQGWPDLSPSTIVAQTGAVYEGDPLTYRLIVRNAGAPLTTPITVTDQLPAGVTYDGGLCAASWGSQPVCHSGSLTWQDTLSVTARVVISLTVRVTADQPTALANSMELDAGIHGQLTRTTTVIANPLNVHLPIVRRNW